MMRSTAALIALLLSGCDLHPASLSAIQVQLTAEPASLDPTLSEDGVSLRILQNTMEGLVGYDGSGQLQNRLAESYSISSDGLRYEFILKPKARWSDRRPVTAADFVTAIRRALDPQNGSKLAGMLFPIRGAQARYLARGEKGRESEKSIAVRDEAGRLVIELQSPAPYFLQVLSLTVAMPQRSDVLASHGGKWPESAPVTGPYRIARHQADRRIQLEPNPHYWDDSRMRRPIEILIVADETTGLNLFEQGKLDIVTKVPSSDIARLRSTPALHTDPYLATFYLSFNHRKPPFNDVHWRRAVSGAVQREELVRALDLGDQPARSWVPAGLEGFIPYADPSSVFAHSMRAVRAKGAPKNAIHAIFDTSHRNSLIMEKVQHDLKDRLGLKLSLSNLDWKSYLKTIQTDPPPLFRLGMLSPFKDPIQVLQSFVSGDPNNYVGFSHPRYDTLVKEIATLSPGEKRVAKIREAQSILVDQEAIVVPLYHYVQNHLVSARVKNFRVNPFGVIRFDELELTNESIGN